MTIFEPFDVDVGQERLAHHLPIDFVRLPLVALTALLLYGERIDAGTILGAALIFAGNYWSVRHEARAIESAGGAAVPTDDG